MPSFAQCEACKAGCADHTGRAGASRRCPLLHFMVAVQVTRDLVAPQPRLRRYSHVRVGHAVSSWWSVPSAACAWSTSSLAFEVFLWVRVATNFPVASSCAKHCKQVSVLCWCRDLGMIPVCVSYKVIVSSVCPASFKLSLALCVSSSNGMCAGGGPIACARVCTTLIREFRKAASASCVVVSSGGTLRGIQVLTPLRDLLRSGLRRPTLQLVRKARFGISCASTRASCGALLWLTLRWSCDGVFVMSLLH